ncbi:adhesin [Methanobrevibacter sp.]|uniref:adhesin n=1 Tax=Methanobrevibacter sp. TaxID=66852 RepID=UPI0038905940
MKIKFTLIDYLIIILVICAIAFAFIHITSDDSSTIQKTAFDASTINKIPDTYTNYYKDGRIVKGVLKGFNASTGEEITLNGTVKWIDDTPSVKLLIENENGTYLTGLFKNTPNADIYMDTISLESDGSVYPNLTEFTIKPQNITSLNDLRKNLTDSEYEISTTITSDSFDPLKIQEIENEIDSHNKRFGVKAAFADNNNQIYLTKADNQNIEISNSILGNIDGLTDKITLRVYNCSDSELNSIKNNYEVTNIRQF